MIDDFLFLSASRPQLRQGAPRGAGRAVGWPGSVTHVSTARPAAPKRQRGEKVFQVLGDNPSIHLSTVGTDETHRLEELTKRSNNISARTTFKTDLSLVKFVSDSGCGDCGNHRKRSEQTESNSGTVYRVTRKQIKGNIQNWRIYLRLPLLLEKAIPATVARHGPADTAGLRTDGRTDTRTGLMGAGGVLTSGSNHGSLSCGSTPPPRAPSSATPRRDADNAMRQQRAARRRGRGATAAATPTQLRGAAGLAGREGTRCAAPDTRPLCMGIGRVLF